MRALRILISIVGGLALAMAGAVVAMKISSGQIIGTDPEKLKADLDLLFDTFEQVQVGNRDGVKVDELLARRVVMHLTATPV